MKTIKIYLSSTKYRWFELNGKNWKFKFQTYLDDLNKPKKFNIKYFDPFDFDSCDPQVVTADKQLINKSDYFVCYLDKITIGTVMEIMYQYDINNIKKFKTISNECLLIDPNSKHREHPWIAYHCKKIFDDVESVAEYIYDKEFSLIKNEEIKK